MLIVSQNLVAEDNMNLRGLQRKEKELKIKYDISGKHILLTGRIPNYTRITIEKKIVELGGILQAKPNSLTNIVVYTRTDTQKYRDATRIKNSMVNIKSISFVTGKKFLSNYLKMEIL